MENSETGNNNEKADKADKALLVLGCPQVPIQTTAVLYIAGRLKKAGIGTVIAGTPAARLLIKYGDIDGHYIDEIKDLDTVIDQVAEKKESYPTCFVFIHNDAGVSYAATMNSLLDGVVYPVVFGSDAEKMSDMIDFECEKITAVAAHNPKPLISAINRVLKWDA